MRVQEEALRRIFATREGSSCGYEIMERVGKGTTCLVESSDGETLQLSDVSDTLRLLRRLGWTPGSAGESLWPLEKVSEDRALAHVLGMCRRLEHRFTLKEIVARIVDERPELVLEFSGVWGRLIRGKVVRKSRSLPDAYELVEPRWM